MIITGYLMALTICIILMITALCIVAYSEGKINKKNKEIIKNGSGFSYYGYFLGVVPDLKGRYITDIHKFDKKKLEECHNYIQYIFPLREKSGTHPEIPVIDDNDLKKIISDERSKINLMKSYKMMYSFYFDRENEDRPKWIGKNNHNYLRITRILKSLEMFGEYEYAAEFYAQLCSTIKEYPDFISKETINHWKSWMVTKI